MKRNLCIVMLCSCGLILGACQGKTAKSPEDSTYSESKPQLQSPYLIDDERLGVVEIPYTEEAGVKHVEVTINGAVTKEAIFDTGASMTCISLIEAVYLASRNNLGEHRGSVSSTVASGDIVDNQVFRVKEIRLSDDLVFRDVECIVNSKLSAPFLLGQNILSSVERYTVDNGRGVIRFELK